MDGNTSSPLLKDTMKGLLIFFPLLILSQIFGVTFMWTLVLVIIILHYYKFISQNNKKKTIKPSKYEKQNEAGREKCEWLNMIITKYWKTCSETQFQAYIPQLLTLINSTESKLLGSVKLLPDRFSLGNNAPIITHVESQAFLSDNTMELDVYFKFNPDTTYQLQVLPFSGSPHVFLELSQLYIAGICRITISFNHVYFPASEFQFSILSLTSVDCKLKFVTIDLMNLPGIQEWIKETITNCLSAFIWPHKLRLDFKGNKYLPPPEGAIIDIGVVFVGEELPDGWELVHRTVTGEFPADLNKNTYGTINGKEMYFCVKRQNLIDKRRENGSKEEGSWQEDEYSESIEGELSPITGLCIFTQTQNETNTIHPFPPKFVPIVKSITNTFDANLNPDSRYSVYLAYTRSQHQKPITKLGVFNKTLENYLPGDCSMVHLTPTGKKANLNKGKQGNDEIYVAYKGGSPSLFGFKPTSSYEQPGLLLVKVISAINLKAQDVGGVCSCHAGVFTSSIIAGTEKILTKVKRTRTIEKNTNPKWDESFVLKATSNDNLNVYIYSKSPPPQKDELVGVVKLPLDTLAMGVEIKGWHELQLAPHGQVLISLTPLTFGMKESWQTNRNLAQLDVGRSGKRIRKFRLVADRQKLVASKEIKISPTQPLSSLVSSFRSIQRTPEEDSIVTSLTSSDEIIISDQITDESAPRLSFSFTEKRGFLDKVTTYPQANKKPKLSKRWVVLKDGQLFCFKTAKEKNPDGTMDLKYAQLSVESGSLVIKSLNDKWELRPTSGDQVTDIDDWVNAIRNAMCVVQQLED